MGREVKAFKTIDEQIEYLQINKSMKVCDIELAYKFLLDNNYYNVVSCGKIKFAEMIECGKFKYGESRFVDWIQYFETDRRISEHLIINVLNFEQTINSRVAYYISELMETGTLNISECDAIKQIIQNSKNVDGIKFQCYSGCETWTYITKMMFGNMKNLIFWLLENKCDIYGEIIKGYPFLAIEDSTNEKKRTKIRARLNEINNLRNKLFHFTPLNIYLVYGKNSGGTLNNNEKRQIVKWVYRLGGNQERFLELEQTCNYSKKFIKMKKRPTTSVD